jgi:hypothetical protein
MEKTLTPPTFRLGPATNKISLDSVPALRQNFRNRSKCPVSQIFHQPNQPNENSITRFFRDLTDKQEICVTKQRSVKKYGHP